MANHDLIFGQRQGSPLIWNQQLGVSCAHNVVIGQNHNLGLEQTHGHDFYLKQASDYDLGLGDTRDCDLLFDHDLALPHAQNYDSGNDHENENGIKPVDANSADVDPDACGIENCEIQLVVSAAENHELDLLENNHELAIVARPEVDENLDQKHDIGVIPCSDVSVNQDQHVVTNPIIQSQTLVLAPTYQLAVGQEFPDAMSCRRALRDTAIALHFEIQTVKSDKSRFTAKCASEGCPWRIHAAKLPGVPTFTIRTIQSQHTCGGITHLGHQQASVQWVADSVEKCLKENPHIKPKEILEEIHRAYGITLSYKQAWRGKERFMAALRDSFEEDYRLLPQYCDQIKRTNPGSIASVYVNTADSCFQRLFVSFQASIFGFLHACRPLMGLDRTVLKSKYLGTLLLATGSDGNGAIFPLAFGVVDEENNDSWMWFLSELHNLLETNTENMPKLTILSDRQNEIVDAVEVNFPTAFHGFCIHYLIESFQKEFNNTSLVNLLWEAASALTLIEFEGKILEIEEISQEAAYWILGVPPRLWATAYFEGTRFGHLTANIVELLNSWIHEVLGLPIIQMMECIRRQLMTWFNERREASMQWSSVLVPSAEKYMSEALERARAYQVLRADEAEFEVISQEGTHTVDIRKRCCDCRGWELYGLPCAHSVAALLSCRQTVHRFAESCFTVANYRKTYSQTIHPVPDRTHWKEMAEGSQVGEDFILDIVVNPPKSLRPPGTPRKRRARGDDQARVKRVVHCSRCNQTGHFRTTCTVPI